MTRSEAANLRILDELEYPKGWPAEGNLAFAKPVVILALRRSSWSQTGVMVALKTANGKTTEVDAGWFKAPVQKEEGFEF